MKYFKKFKTQEKYNAYIGSGEKILPNVSYIVSPKDAKFNLFNGGIIVKNLQWIKDVAATGGVANKNNCIYTVVVHTSGGEIDVTHKTQVTGSLSVSSTTLSTRRSIGELVLTFKFYNLTMTASTTAYQEGNTNIYSIGFSGLTWVTDIPYLGGTATKNNCSYWVVGYYVDNTTVDITSTATVTDNSVVVPESTAITRQIVGTLTLNAEYNTLTTTSDIDVWQKGLPQCVTMTATAKQTVKPPTGKTFEYSYDDIQWSAMSGAVTFGTSGKQTVYIRGKNTNGINATFTFSSTTNVSIGGTAMGLLDWENPPTTVPVSGFTNLFYGQTAIKSVSSNFLPATGLNAYCYYGMFGECDSLTSAPDLPATTLANGCYERMFYYCISLTTVPVLPATTMVYHCYYSMFQGCIKITKAPYLPSTYLRNTCYGYMFYGCTNLNEIHCDATNSWFLKDEVNSWTYGVSSTGDFYGKSAADWESGASGIPNGWARHLS